MNKNKVYRLQGFKEAMRLLEQVEKESTKRTILVQAMRKSARPMVQKAKSLASRVSKDIAKSITVRRIKMRRKLVGVSVKPTVYYSHFVEFGTSGIISKKGGYKRASDNPKFAVWVGKLKDGNRYRVDQPEKPFMRPAIDATKKQVMQNLKNNLAKDVETLIKKYNKRKVS